MDSNIYYFKASEDTASFIKSFGHQISYNTIVDYFKYQSDAQGDLTCTQTPLSKQGLGGELNQHISLPSLNIIYGKRMSNLFLWAYDNQQAVRGYIEPQNLVSANVQFPRTLLHKNDWCKCDVDASGKINYAPAVNEAYRRYHQLQTLSRAVDNSSAACRRSLDLNKESDVRKLYDIYATDGACHLKIQDSMTRVIAAVAGEMISKLPLEFTLHLQEFQNRAQQNYADYGSEFGEPPQTIQRCVYSIQNALDWLADTVRSEGQCESPEVWASYQELRNQLTEAMFQTSIELPSTQSIFLVEHRNLGQKVNYATDSKQMLPAFSSWSEMNAYIQTEANRLYQKDPSDTGYFMIYHCNAVKAQPIMSLAEVSMDYTDVYMLGNGIFNAATYTLSTAIPEQERRLCTWLAIQDFSAEHGLNHLALLEWPTKECEKLRDAFSSGGILESGMFNADKDADNSTMKYLRSIQKLLCGQYATFETVYTAVTIEEVYKQNLAHHLECGLSTQDATCKATWKALEDALCYTKQHPQYNILTNIFEACFEVERENEDAFEYLDYCANNLPDEYQHFDIS